MNYIKHTVAAHEHLRQQPAATTLHLALYWALFFQWNAHYFGNGIDLDHEAAMQAARIGNRKTYRATLYDLDAWGLLTYQPSKSRHHASRCVLTDLSGAKVPQVKPPTEGRSAPDEKSLPGADMPQALRTEVPSIATLPGAEVPQDSLVVQTSFQTVVPNSSGSQKKEGERFAGEGLSEVQVLDDNRRTASATASSDEPEPASGAAPKTPRKREVVPRMRVKHSEGVGQELPTIPTASDEPRLQRRTPLPELPFSQSAIASPDAFVAAFLGGDYELADLRHYHQLVATWRDKKTGQEPLRRDWIATAKRFMLNDAADNRLKLAPNVQPHQPGTRPEQAVGSGIPSIGYRSKRWD